MHRQSGGDGRIDWNVVSETVSAYDDSHMNPIDCQRLWKYIAYGNNIKDDKICEYDSDEVIAGLENYKSTLPGSLPSRTKHISKLTRQ